MKTTVSAKEFAIHISELMPRLMRGMIKTEQTDCAGADITMTQIWALGYLRENGESPVKDIAKAVGLKLPATSGLVERMVKAGLVKRTRSEKDRRIVLVASTAKGRKMLAKVLEEKAKSITALFSPLSARERAQYIGILEKIVKRMDDQ